MGTPHRGADIAYWTKILGKLANIPLLGSIRTELLKDLAPKSSVLGEICSQFVERGVNLKIFSFYERVKTSGLNDLVSIIFPKPPNLSAQIDFLLIKGRS
jgi:hypothetical protein